MKSLFPDMDREIRDDRKASRRETVQQARHWLREHDMSWLVNQLLDNGPMTDHTLILTSGEENYHAEDAIRRSCDVLCGLVALWYVRKLWRLKLGRHPGSGEVQYLYGIRGVHDLERAALESKGAGNHAPSNA